MRQVYTHCTVDGCGLLHKARGLCNTHYAQLKRGVNPGQPIKRREMQKPDSCSVESCGHPVKSKGLCHMHYARQLRHGYVKNPDRTKPFKVCWYNGCDGRAICQGLCNLHYTHAKSIKKKYGLSMQDYLAMVHYQCGTCYICGKPETKVDPRSGRVHMLAVDHCHHTGKVRGLLCDKHNRAIGLMDDDAGILNRAIEYIQGNAQPFGFWLEQYPATQTIHRPLNSAGL